MPLLQKQHVLPGLIAVLTIAFIASLRTSFRDALGPAVQIGDEAPDFQLISDAGQPIQLKDFRDKFVILNFWASWCPPCVEELPSLNRFQERFSSRGVVVLGVSVDEDAIAYQRFVSKAGVKFVTTRDPSRKVMHMYGTFKVPETYFIDRQGKVVHKVISNADWMDPQMLDYMEQLLKG